MKYFVLILCLSLGILLSCDNQDDTNTIRNIDRIEIISINPSTGLEDGVEYNFIVEVDYDLATFDSGELAIGFNTRFMDTFNLLRTTSIVDRGSGNHTFNVFVKAKNWGPNEDFKVIVQLNEYPHPSSSFMPLANDIFSLRFSN